MRYTGAVVTVLAIAALGGCSGSDSKTSSASQTSQPRSSTASPEESTPTPTPAPEKTYVPAAGDPKTHAFDVTIHDVLPLDAYEVDGDHCVATAIPDFPSQLSFNGPSRHFEERPLDESFTIPQTARLLADGSCEATMHVTVPYKPQYRAGIGIEGRGILRPTDPSNEIFKTKGDRQAIAVLR